MNNIKESWNGINILTGKCKTSPDIKSVQYKDDILTYNQEMSQSLNKYFSIIANELDSSSPPLEISFILFKILKNSFFLHQTTSAEIFQLNNTYYRLNKVPTVIYKEIKVHIRHPLSHIINESFSSGISTDALKTACVTPMVLYT